MPPASFDNRLLMFYDLGQDVHICTSDRLSFVPETTHVHWGPSVCNDIPGNTTSMCIIFPPVTDIDLATEYKILVKTYKHICEPNSNDVQFVIIHNKMQQ